MQYHKLVLLASAVDPLSTSLLGSNIKKCTGEVGHILCYVSIKINKPATRVDEDETAVDESCGSKLKVGTYCKC